MRDRTTGAAVSSKSTQVGPNWVNSITCSNPRTTARARSASGATRARPPRCENSTRRSISRKLQSLAEALVKDEIPNDPQAQQVQDLMLLGTSMGGARPKAVVQDGEGLWIAKFNRDDDRWNNTRVEHAMLRLARECGLNTAESRIETVGTKDVLLVRRFDRERAAKGYTRARMVSGLTLLRADEAPQARQNWSYLILVEALRRVVADAKSDARELFRRICFNALISNLDDHPRNHAVLAKDKSWQLSPAYDLTPSVPVSSEHRDLAMDCGDQVAMPMPRTFCRSMLAFCSIGTRRKRS